MSDPLMTDIDIPKYSKSIGTAKRFSPMVWPKTNKPGEFYRVRLLKIDGTESGRDYPFIIRHIHDHWAQNDKGFKVPDDSVTCLKTKYVDYPSKRKYTDCPMCNHANENFGIWKNSGYKDSVSGGKFNAMKEKFQEIFAAYIVNDPNNPKNNDRMKTFMFTKKALGKKDPCRDELCADDFERIVREEIIKAKLSAQNGNPYTIWNGRKAVDLCFVVEDRPIVYHRGEPNEYTYNAKIITKIWFTKEPYDIPAITNEAMKNLDFDQFYTSSTPEEIEAFYRKYYYSGTTNVPKEVIEIPDSMPRSNQSSGFQSASMMNTSTPKTSIPKVEIEGIDDLLPSDSDVQTRKSEDTGDFVDPMAGIDVDKDFENIIDGL